eukprot:scaffold3376_cov151-Amphora_coffeaeformis.AAC.3
MALMSSYYWAGFPFDNLCPLDTTVNETWIGNWTDVGKKTTDVVTGFMHLFHGTYEARGDDMNIPFSEVASISAYVPQVESPVYSYPLLACNIDGIDPDLLDWTDPDRPYSFYDLTKDAEVLLKGMDVSSNVTFSQIAHYPPEGKADEKKSESES